jgi:hypothetical protein
MPKSNKERQALLRKRRAEDGLKELRGIYANDSDRAKIKAYAKALETRSSSVKKE